MNTPVPIPGLTAEPFHGEPIILGVDLASRPDRTSWSLVYINADGERIVGLTGTGEPPAGLAESFNEAAERQKLKGRFGMETLVKD